MINKKPILAVEETWNKSHITCTIDLFTISINNILMSNYEYIKKSNHN